MKLDNEPKYRIISDGTPQGTKVFDPDGKELQNLISVSVFINMDQVSVGIIEITNIEYDIKVKQENATKYKENECSGFDEE